MAGFKIVTLNVLVNEEQAEKIANHLSEESRDSDSCGLADFARRNHIVIHDYGTVIKDETNKTTEG